jgi:hypothetical protein
VEEFVVGDDGEGERRPEEPLAQSPLDEVQASRRRALLLLGDEFTQALGLRLITTDDHDPLQLLGQSHQFGHETVRIPALEGERPDAQVHGRKFCPIIHTNFENIALGLALAPGTFPVWHVLAAQRAMGTLVIDTPIKKAVEVSLMRDILGLQKVSV